MDNKQILIPRKIHYFWFGKGKMNRKNEKYIKAWKKKCPDFEICRWDESNFDFSDNRFAREAYEAGKYCFVSDYARTKVLYEQGGIQLDTDVEILRDLTDLCKYEGFIGFETDKEVNDGQGFGVVPGHPIVKEMLDTYKDIPFKKEDGSFNMLLSPKARTDVLVNHGLELNGKRQNVEGIEILPADFLCPKDFTTRRLNITENTYSIHHFDSSWHTKKEKRELFIISVLSRLYGNERGLKKYNSYRKFVKKIRGKHG